MSLISPGNFVAPFKNAVHLGLIVVIAVVFAIYRYSGGGVNISSRKSPPSTLREAPKVSALEELSQSEKAVKAKQPTQSLTEQDTALGDLLDNSRPAASRRNDPSTSKSSSLEDIEKQLGVD